MRKSNLLSQMAAGLVALMLAVTVLAGDKLPEVSHDGLHLMKDTKLRAVYMKPGANLDEYSKIALLECYVAFAKNWQREHNDNTVGLMNRVTDTEMKKIRDNLSAQFNKVFTKVLSTKGGHEMVKAGGTGVLIIRPAIVNLKITAPDTMNAGMEMNYTANTGQMTLYMELLDGKTGDIIARVIDPEATGDGFFQIANSVTNTADADRVMKRWATILEDHLATMPDASKK